jgi:hypothetical protein
MISMLFDHLGAQGTVRVSIYNHSHIKGSP